MPHPAHVDPIVLAQQALAVGDAGTAVRILSDAVRRLPQRSDMGVLLGRIHWQCGRTDLACAAWRAAMAAAPRDPTPAAWLAEGLLEGGSIRESIAIAERLVAASGHDPMPWSTLIRGQRQFGDGGGALPVALRAVARLPQDPGLLYISAVVAQENRRHRLTGELAGRLLAIEPRHPGGRSLLVDALARTSDWQRLPAATAPMLELAGVQGPEPGLVDVAFASDDPQVMARATRAVAAALPQPGPRPARRMRGDGRIGICYLSPDLREHPVARMLLPVLKAHDRSRFGIVLGALRPFDAGIGAELLRHADAGIDLSGMGDAAAAQALAAAGIDVLVDLAGATTHNRYGILARRPAPAQVLWLGCPTGTAADWYDAYLLDAEVHPADATPYLREPIRRLDACYHPMPVGEGVAAVTRDDMGFRPEDLVLACPHAPHKVRPPIVDAWMRICAARPRTVLWLDAADEEARTTIVAYAERFGVAPGRIRFWPFQADRARYLGCLALADLFLDCHPYGAHSTTGEAIAVGVPVVTAAGRCIHARVAASMLRRTGLEHGIQPGLAAYEAKILDLCDDPEQLRRWRRAAEAARASLPGELHRLVGELERSYADLAERPPGAGGAQGRP